LIKNLDNDQEIAEGFRSPRKSDHFLLSQCPTFLKKKPIENQFAISHVIQSADRQTENTSGPSLDELSNKQAVMHYSRHRLTALVHGLRD